MIPGSYDLPITENSTNVFTFVIAGITTATNYSAAVDIRIDRPPTSTLLLGLTSPSGGIVLTSDGSNLTVVVTITETQVDTIMPGVVANVTASWSLKITAPGGTTLQYLLGTVAPTRTPTA